MEGGMVMPNHWLRYSGNEKRKIPVKVAIRPSRAPRTKFLPAAQVPQENITSVSEVCSAAG